MNKRQKKKRFKKKMIGAAEGAMKMFIEKYGDIEERTKKKRP